MGSSILLIHTRSWLVDWRRYILGASANLCSVAAIPGPCCSTCPTPMLVHFSPPTLGFKPHTTAEAQASLRLPRSLFASSSSVAGSLLTLAASDVLRWRFFLAGRRPLAPLSGLALLLAVDLVAGHCASALAPPGAAGASHCWTWIALSSVRPYVVRRGFSMVVDVAPGVPRVVPFPRSVQAWRFTSGGPQPPPPRCCDPARGRRDV